MKRNLLFLVLFFAANYANAQSVNVNFLWQLILGGSQNDIAKKIDRASDGSLVFCGITDSQNGDVVGNHSNTSGTYDYWVGKVNSQGNVMWTATLGGTANDEAQYVAATSDGGLVVAGFSNSNNGNVTENFGAYDFWVVKLDATGVIQWQKTIGSSAAEKAYSIKQTSDGGYIVGGAYIGGFGGDNQVMLVKLSSTGNIVWQKIYGGSGSETFWDVAPTNDGGYIFAGFTTSNNGGISGNHGMGDAWVVKVDSNGIVQWQKCLGGSKEDLARSIQQTSDGAYIMAGYSKSNDGDLTHHYGADTSSDAWVVKLSSTGTILWQKNYGGTSSDQFYSIRETSDGGFVAIGIVDSTDGDLVGTDGGSIYKIDNVGNIEWIANRSGYGVVETGNNQYALIASYTGDPINNDPIKTGFNIYIAKFEYSNLNVSEISNQNSYSIYPNPAQDYIIVRADKNDRIQYKIFDMTGRLIKTGNSQSTDKIDVRDIETGTYMINIQSNNLNKALKFIKK